MSDTIFVTGAAGQLGRLVIKHLLAHGVTHDRIIAGTRSPEKLSELAAAGVQVRKADFDDPQGLTAAFKGADSVLIISTDALDGTDTRLRQHRNAVDSAVAAGVKRLAYTSLPNPDRSLLTFAPDHLGTERAIQATGQPYVFFRNGWYQENLLLSLPNALKSGQWHTAARDGKTAFVAREEIAEAIAVALATFSAENRTYTFTGAEAFSNEEVASLASKATGKPLAVVQVDDEQFAQGLKAAGLSNIFVDVLVSVEAEVRAGNLSIVTDHVQSLIGRAPKRLAAYLEESKAAYAG